MNEQQINSTQENLTPRLLIVSGEKYVSLNFGFQLQFCKPNKIELNET